MHKPETGPFGGPVAVAGPGALPSSPAGNMDLVRRTLAALNPGAPGLLRLHCPQPTAAFSRRDIINPGYAAAETAVREHGFEPVARPAGGRLAAYDRGALVLDLVAPHPDPRRDPIGRFQLMADFIAATLRTVGVDARVGPVEHEFCPGEHSVNAGGRRKLAGIAQRIGARGYHLGAVIMVEHAERARDAMAAAYPLLELPLDIGTVGAIRDEAPGVSPEDVAAAIIAGLPRLVPTLESLPGTSGEGHGYAELSDAIEPVS